MTDPHHPPRCALLSCTLALLACGPATSRSPAGFGSVGSGASDGTGGASGLSSADGAGPTDDGTDAHDGSTAADPGSSGPDTPGGSDTSSTSTADSTGTAPGGTVDADTFPSIQAAIDSLEGIGGAVYISAGEHTVPEKLRLHSGITVFGAGMDVTIVRLADDAAPDHLLANDSTSGREHMAIRGLTLQGRTGDGGDDACCYGLRLEQVDDVLVADVAARDHGRDGFYLGYQHVDEVPIGVTNVRLSGVVASGNGRNGLSLVQGSGVLVDGGSFEHNNVRELVAAIDLEPDPYPDGLVTGNRIVGNLVRDNANNGIQLYAEGGAIVSANAVCSNTITDNDGTGIADIQADDDVFVDNQLSDNGADAHYDGSALPGDDYADACGLPLPDLPPLPPLPN